ncbi:hypothetical protein NEMBOFW57_007253 [Staphylotrichum longicolle]|uniref:Uncharacterized protein n=1 Tax=Staphylotrichum longicolle TaxID=669026 RepID=A0AAD4EUX7_9PEZI|nr:hypothetical protein NEMBOFW57_007253 [Staphylotrichum longicolle]
MNHSGKIKQNLEILGLENLENVSLSLLLRIITERLPSNVSKTQVLNIYTMWLHSRLVALDISPEGTVRHEITNWYRFLKTLRNEDNLISEAFCDWQRGEVMENPTSLRRLSIAEAELSRLMSDPPTSPEPGSDFGQSDAHYGQMHPDRIRLSREDNTVIEADHDEADVVFLPSSTLAKVSTSVQNHALSGEPDLSFLTGSNKVALNDMTKMSSDNETSPSTSYFKSKPMPAVPGAPSKKAAGKKNGAPEKLNTDYHICDRTLNFRDVPKAEHVDRLLVDSDAGRGRSKSPLPETKGDQLGDYRLSPAESFSRLRLSSAGKHQGKRKASTSPAPEKAGLRKKHQTQAHKGIKKGRILSFPDDVLSKRKDREEGRLSYDDEVYGEDLPSPVAKRTVRLPEAEMTDTAHEPEKPVSVTKTDLSGFIRCRLFELDLMEMIQAESTKTDLMFIIDGVERMPPCDSFLVKLFKGQEGIGVNERFKKIRPCPTDYFQYLVTAEEIEMIDCKMATEVDAAAVKGTPGAFDGKEAVGSGMMHEEPALTVATKDADAEMADVAASAVIFISSDEEDAVMLEAGSPKFEESLPRMDGFEAGAIAAPATDGSGTNGVPQEALPGALAETLDSGFKSSSICEVVHVDLTVSSPPRPLEGTTMEIEASPRTSESPASRHIKPFAQAIHEEVEMAGTVTAKAPAFPEKDGEAIVINDSSQPSEAS